MIGGDAQLRQQLSALDTATSQWHRTVATPTVAGIGAGDPAAVRLIEGSVAKRLFDAVRTRSAELSADVDRRTNRLTAALAALASSVPAAPSAATDKSAAPDWKIDRGMFAIP